MEKEAESGRMRGISPKKGGMTLGELIGMADRLHLGRDRVLMVRDTFQRRAMPAVSLCPVPGKLVLLGGVIRESGEPAPSVRREPYWRRVCEELPEIGQRVLMREVWEDPGDGTRNITLKETVFTSPRYFQNRMSLNKKKSLNITHWLPLPSLPAGSSPTDCVSPLEA